MNNYPNEGHQHLGEYVRTQVIPEGMSVSKAARTMGVGRPALSNFLNGNSELSSEMLARLEKTFGADADDLMKRRAVYQAADQRSRQVVSATARTFVPPFLMATANEIESWADTHQSRDQLAVLLRLLVHSTCDGLKYIDFPGNDDAQRRGWDGRIHATEGNPWVPEGESRWEFGTGGNITAKANKDFATRTAANSQEERQNRVFVFVTPRRWNAKDSWIRDKRAQKRWRDVWAWDASDLEQWLEQSIPAQVWFAGRPGQQVFRGAKSLDRCWVEWCADCDPCFTKDIFAEAVSAFGDRVIEHLRGEEPEVLRIIADSRQEGLAYINAVLSKSPDVAAIKDRVVVFTEPGAMSELAVGSPGFIPVIADSQVEVELAQSGVKLKSLVVEHRTAARHGSGIWLEPLSHQGFREALESMGLGSDKIKRLDRESGRSLTVLRRRLAQREAIRTPAWSAQADLATSLIPMAFAGAWVASNEADRYLISEITGSDYNHLEGEFTKMLNLQDSPVWTVGDYRGVVSKIDALYGISRWTSVDVVKRFFDVAELVLSEPDPALDLPEHERWAAAIHGKAREISSPLRKSIGETLVLLAIHGRRLFGERMSLDPEHEVSNLVRKLLEPLTAEKLLSQSSNLPLYAEAAPKTFLAVFENDLAREQPVVSALMKPSGNAVFERNDRAPLLWALELLAWRPDWLPRVVELLAKLASLEPDDNWANKPSESLQSIFRSWMPQTAADVQHRIVILNDLKSKHPKLAWRIATAQFDPARRVGDYSHKPIWRDYAAGHGDPVSRIESHNTFVLHCIEACIHWPLHTQDTLADLMWRTDQISLSQLRELSVALKAWARSASDKDRAWLRERIRVSMSRDIRRKSKGVQPRHKDERERVQIAREAYDVLEPQDLVWKHAWLFENPWVEESWGEMEGDIDVHQRDQRVQAWRGQAVKEVLRELGERGVLELAFSGNAAHAAGWSFAQVVSDPEARLSFAKTVTLDADLLQSLPHQSLIRGLFEGVGSEIAVSLVEMLWSECSDEMGVKLLCLAAFERSVWDRLDAFGDSVADCYWKTVEATWRRHADEDINYAASRLLAANRPAAALEFAHLDWGRLESRHIHKILSQLPSSDEGQRRGARPDRYQIRGAIEVLTERNVFEQADLARLELLYMDVFFLDDEGVPNLEKEVEANPELFCEAVTLAYRREDQDDKAELSERERNLAQTAYQLLDSITRIPGHDENGNLSEERLADWIRKSQALCEANGRRRMCDYQIGELLSAAPLGEDGIWPCEPVRTVLDAVLNDDIRGGFQTGRRNSRGVQLRTAGGTQERELAHQYEEWAQACEYSFPKVAAALRDLASAYQADGRWWDREAAIQQRLGY